MHWFVIPALALASLLSVWDADLPIAMILGLTAVTGLWQLASGRWQMSAFPAPLSWAFLLFGLWAGLSTLWSAAPFDSWRALSVWLLLPIWAWMLGAVPVKSLKPVVILAGAIVFLLAVLAYAERFLGVATDAFRAASVFANPNTFGTLVVAAMMPLQHLWLGRAMHNQTRFVTVTGGVFLCLMFGAVLLTASRGAMLCYAGLTFTQLWLLRDVVRAHWRSALAYFASLMVLGVVLNIDREQLIVERFAYFTESVGTAERLTVWATAWRAFLLEPWIGHGFGALSVPYAALREQADYTYGQFAHNDLLQYFTELGIPGGLLALAMAGLFAWMTVARCRIGFRNPSNRLWFEAVSCGVLVVILSSFITYMLYLPVILLFVAVLLGLWAALYWVDDEDVPTRKKRPVSAFLFLAGMALLTGFHVSSMMSVRADGALRQYSLKGHYDANILASRLSFDLNPRVRLEWADVALSKASQDKDRESLGHVDGVLGRLERQQPSLPQLWLLRARLELARGDTDLALRHLRQAAGQDPTFLPARLFIAKLYEETGRPAEAQAERDSILQWAAIHRKYGVSTMEDLKAYEESLPRLTKSR